MTGWFRIRMMSQSGVTCLPAECCFSGFKNVFNLDPTMYISNGNKNSIIFYQIWS
jgi:hypothetical protein